MKVRTEFVGAQNKKMAGGSHYENQVFHNLAQSAVLFVIFMVYRFDADFIQMN